MPSEIVLQRHNDCWGAAAEAAIQRLLSAANALVAIHHIGSTSIPEILAKPIIDLLGVAKDLPSLDGQAPAIEGLGYEWRGEYGLPGRRYCTLSDSFGRRLLHLHCYASGDPSIGRHLAFRDHLRAFPDVAKAYEQQKLQCQQLHPTDGGAYTECKGAWIRRMEQQAMRQVAAGDLSQSLGQSLTDANHTSEAQEPEERSAPD